MASLVSSSSRRGQRSASAPPAYARDNDQHSDSDSGASCSASDDHDHDRLEDTSTSDDMPSLAGPASSNDSFMPQYMSRSAHRDGSPGASSDLVSSIKSRFVEREGFAVGCLLTIVCVVVIGLTTFALTSHADIDAVCPAQNLVYPVPSESLELMLTNMSSFRFSNITLDDWQSLVRINTSVTEDGSFARNPWNETMYGQFPEVFAQLDVDVLDDGAYVMTWPGAKPELKPICYTGHFGMDPVIDARGWRFPPLAGVFDGDMLWGRGVVDKGQMAALLTAVRALLQTHFQPQRTILLAFDLLQEDAEHRVQLTSLMTKHIYSIYDRHGVEAVIAPGGYGLMVGPGSGTLYALPSAAEHGLFSVEITTKNLAVGDNHSTIDIFERLLEVMTRENPYSPGIDKSHPLIEWAMCLYSDEEASDLLRKQLNEVIQSSDDSERSSRLKTLLKAYPMFHDILSSQFIHRTTSRLQRSGLLELMTMYVDFTLPLHASLHATEEHVVQVGNAAAVDFKMPVHAFKDHRGEHLEVELECDMALRPETLAEIESKPWVKFSGALRAFFGEETRVAPLATAALSNRDWLSITQNLFRFTPYRQSSYLNKHSTNEQASLEDQVEMVMYYYQLMRTMNGEEVAEDEEGEKGMVNTTEASGYSTATG